MKILKSNDVLPKGVAIALGAFDGIHMGHRKLIENIVDYSKYNGCSSCVYTFDILLSAASSQETVIIPFFCVTDVITGCAGAVVIGTSAQ